MTGKILKQIICIVILFMAFLPMQLRAADIAPTPAPIFDGGGTTDKSDTQTGLETIKTNLANSGVVGTANVSDLVLKYVNFALPYLALAAFLGFVYAGFLYVTAYGAEEQTTKAKKIMLYAVIGLVVVILSYSIVQLLTGQLVQGIQSQTK